MVAFIVFSLSCYSTKNIRLDADTAKENGKIKMDIDRYLWILIDIF